MTVGLIGFGRLGRLLARYFGRRLKVFVYDTKLDAAAARALGARPATLQEACAQDVVLLCVPIAALEGVLGRIKGLVKPGTLVVDTCSVKERPVRLMKKILPRSVEILGTHPNFGPDSAAESLRGHKLVLCPVRIKKARYARIKAALKAEGLQLVEMTPAAHDRKAAESLVLTHFIGRGLIAFGAETTGIDTEGYKRLLRILQTVQNDSWQLFQDMNRFNAYAPAMRRRLLKAMKAVDAKVRR